MKSAAAAYFAQPSDCPSGGAEAVRVGKITFENVFS